MPLIGLVDPSHNERAQDEPGRLPTWMPVEEVLHHARTGDPKWSPWPYELIRAAVNEHQERDYISSTMLTGGCGRGKVLERKADYVGDVDSMYASLMGTLVHRTLEHSARSNSVAEYRFFTDFELADGREVVVSCSPDAVIYEGETGIWDWKKTDNPPTFGYPWKSHDRQVQYNRYIVNHAKTWHDADGVETTLPFSPWELVFKHLVLVYLGPKGPKVIEVMKTQEVPSPKTGKPVKRKMPYIWPDAEVEADLMPRLEAMVLALDSYPEWPEGLETMAGFEGPAGWACPGRPWCSLPNCLAKRYPEGLSW